MMHYWGQPYVGSWGLGAGEFGVILFVAFWALIIFLALTLVFKVLGHDHRRHGYHRRWDEEYENRSESVEALDILKKRYAKGEITRKEFDEMKKDIA